MVSRDEKLHTAVLVAPASERRRLRKQRRQAAARLVAEQRQAEKATARAKLEAERAERRATVYLSSAGEPGPAAQEPAEDACGADRMGRRESPFDDGSIREIVPARQRAGVGRGVHGGSCVCARGLRALPGPARAACRAGGQGWRRSSRTSVLPDLRSRRNHIFRLK